MKDFKELEIWKRSHKLTVDIYRATQKFPKEEIYGLTSQIRRAVSSIPTNIAEGCGRRTNAELANFLNIASGSASEVEYELLLAKDINYLTDIQYQQFAKEVREIRSMLAAYMRTLTSSNQKSVVSNQKKKSEN